jgi:tetratricopeptide (TPR) repeat protein
MTLQKKLAIPAAALALLALLAPPSRPQAAVNDLLAANQIYNSDTVLLNALGTCFLKLGQKDQALNVFQASLKLNDKQEDIQKIVAGLVRK